jgi:glycogen debranching enzyme
MSRESFSGWGIRTMARGERRYNPMSYHNGSIWPHDNSLIALGFARYGLKDAALRLFDAQFDAARYMDLFRLPELFCGFRRQVGRAPTRYPVACNPQAWAAGAPFALLQACLGLSIDAAAREIRFVAPALPPSVRQIRLSGLRLGESRADVELTRRDADVAVDVLRREGDVKIVVAK